MRAREEGEKKGWVVLVRFHSKVNDPSQTGNCRHQPHLLLADFSLSSPFLSLFLCSSSSSSSSSSPASPPLPLFPPQIASSHHLCPRAARDLRPHVEGHVSKVPRLKALQKGAEKMGAGGGCSHIVHYRSSQQQQQQQSFESPAIFTSTVIVIVSQDAERDKGEATHAQELFLHAARVRGKAVLLPMQFEANGQRTDKKKEGAGNSECE